MKTIYATSTIGQAERIANCMNAFAETAVHTVTAQSRCRGLWDRIAASQIAKAALSEAGVGNGSL